MDEMLLYDDILENLVLDTTPDEGCRRLAAYRGGRYLVYLSVRLPGTFREQAADQVYEDITGQPTERI